MDSYLSTLCHLIVYALPRLSGEEIEHIWQMMEELVERRKLEARQLRALAQGER